jgi:hypothetical protein
LRQPLEPAAILVSPVHPALRHQQGGAHGAHGALVLAVALLHVAVLASVCIKRMAGRQQHR